MSEHTYTAANCDMLCGYCGKPIVRDFVQGNATSYHPECVHGPDHDAAITDLRAQLESERNWAMLAKEEQAMLTERIAALCAHLDAAQAQLKLANHQVAMLMNLRTKAEAERDAANAKIAVLWKWSRPRVLTANECTIGNVRYENAKEEVAAILEDKNLERENS